MANSANLPAPYLGVQENIPIATVKSPYCEKLFNFNTSQGGITLRNGDSLYNKFTSADTLVPGLFAQYGDTKLFVHFFDVTDNKMKILDVDANSIVYSSAASGSAAWIPQFFNNYIFWFDPGTYVPGIHYTGAAFGSINYNNGGTPAVTFLPTGGGTGYNHRNYIIQNNTAAYWYSGIDAISGNCTYVDLSGVINQKTTLANISSFTLSDQVTAVKIQAFIFANGYILFYSGSYPDSDDWRILGDAKIGQLLSYSGSTFPYQGDTIVLCDSGVVSLRDLFLKGSEDAVSLTVNAHMQKTWRDLIKTARAASGVLSGPLNAHIRGIWDEQNSRLIVSFPYNWYPGDSSQFNAAGSFYFIYDTLNQAWFYHRSYGVSGSGINDIVSYKTKVILLVVPGSTNIVTLQKEGSSGFQDRNNIDAANVNYVYEMLSAPIPFPKTAVEEALQVEPIMQSDLYPQTNWNFVADFGRQTTGNQPLTDQGTSVTKPAVNIGMQGTTYTQVKMSGTTTSGKTVGLILYSYNIWYSAGETASR